MTRSQSDSLIDATDDELISLLGIQALPLIEGPRELLKAGRAGEFWISGPDIQGSKSLFIHKRFENAGKIFLTLWSQQLRAAICEDKELYANLRRKGLDQIDLLVAAVVGSLSASIPQIAPFSGLLTVLSVLVARSGGKAFCEMLTELEASRTPRTRRARARGVSDGRTHSKREPPTK